jgi:hypothetical protein
MLSSRIESLCDFLTFVLSGSLVTDFLLQSVNLIFLASQFIFKARNLTFLILLVCPRKFLKLPLLISGIASHLLSFISF